MSTPESVEKNPTLISTSTAWLFWAFLITFIGALALTVGQQALLQYSEQHAVIKDFILRFLLMFLFYGFVVLLFPKFMLTVWFFLAAVYQTGILFYFSYFNVPPSFAVIMNNFDEGLGVLGAISDIFPWKTLCIFLLLAGLQCYLLRRRSRFSLPWKTRGVYLLICSVLLAGLFIGQNPANRMRSLNSRFVYPLEPKIAKFGLLPVFCHEAWFLHHHPLSKIVEEADKQTQNQSRILQDEYCPQQEWKNIIVVQVESLDYAVMNLKKAGKEVVPFINSLSAQSLTYRIWTKPVFGSATADFTMLNGCPPANGLFNYNIPGYSFPCSLPAFLKQHGYVTFAVHGVRGTFYNRKNAFEAMQIEHRAFREDIAEEFDKAPEKYKPLLPTLSVEQAVARQWLDDETLFAYTRNILQEHQDSRNFILIITESSHGPWRDDRADLIADEKSPQDRYLNSIHGLDKDLQRFYESLPTGTLFLIYGDHTPHFASGSYVSDMAGDKQFVPLIISVKGENINPFQKIHVKDQISLRDVYSYIKKAVENPQAEQRQATVPSSQTIR